MDPLIPTSFIPKRPIVTDVRHETAHRPLGLLSLFTTVVFLGTIIAAGGVFFYERQLEIQKVQMEQKIIKAKQELNSDFLTEMKQFDNRITAIKTLIQNHVVVTPIFNALEDSTLRSVQYKSFAYTFSSTETSRQRLVQVEMAGNARNYEAIALQSDAFTKSNFIKDAVFSNLTVEDKKSTINFNLKFNVESQALSYQAFIDKLENPVPSAGANI